MDTGEAALLAALFVVFVSIPAASQSVEVTEEGFQGVIDSKYTDLFKVDFKAGKYIMEMLDSEKRLEVNKSFRRKTIRLQTSKGFIKKVRTSKSINTTVQTPYGRFESGVVNGENFSRFDGGNREKAREIKKDLKRRLDKSLESANAKKRVVVQEMLPNVEVSVEARNDDVEHFNLTNTGSKAVDLNGWNVVAEDSNGEAGGTIELGTVLEPGEKKVYYSSTRETLEENGYRVGENAVVNSGLNIYNSGGEVKLYTGEERLVDSESY